MKCPSCYEVIASGADYCECGWRDPKSVKNGPGPIRLVGCITAGCDKVGKYQSPAGRVCADHYTAPSRSSVHHDPRSAPPGGWESLHKILKRTPLPEREPGSDDV